MRTVGGRALRSDQRLREEGVVVVFCAASVGGGEAEGYGGWTDSEGSRRFAVAGSTDDEVVVIFCPEVWDGADGGTSAEAAWGCGWSNVRLGTGIVSDAGPAGGIMPGRRGAGDAVATSGSRSLMRRCGDGGFGGGGCGG